MRVFVSRTGQLLDQIKDSKKKEESHKESEKSSARCEMMLLYTTGNVFLPSLLQTK